MSRQRARRALWGALACLLALWVATAATSWGDTTQHGNLRLTFNGSLTPHRLPRRGVVPVHVSVSARIASTDGSTPPQLRHISIAINRHGRFDPAGLPICQLSELQPSNNADALRACGRSLVGVGHFSSRVLLPQSTPFPSSGKLYAFNGSYRGHPAILAHVYGTDPIPTSNTIPFILNATRGTFGTTLQASLPAFTSNWGYVTGLSLRLGRTFKVHGARHSYLSAGCPTPTGVGVVSFPLTRAVFGFSGRKPVSQTLTRSCRVRR